MTRRTNARVAGFAFLLYIAIGITSMVLFSKATGGEGVAEQLASMAQHPSNLRIAAALTLLTCFAALVLGVTLYSITRDEDPDLAMLALTCRVGEGVIGGVSIHRSMGLLWLATADGPNALDPQATHDIGAFLLWGQTWSPTICATFFAVGSTLFSWLLLRGRMIPTALAWLGVVASVLLVLGLPLQVAGVLRGSVTQLLWIPMAAFEIPLAFWLIIKGVGPRKELAAGSQPDQGGWK